MGLRRIAKPIDASASSFSRSRGWERIARQLRLGTFSADLIAKEAANAIWRARGEIPGEEADLMFNALKELLHGPV